MTISAAIVFVRGGHLGRLDMAATFFRDALAELFAPVSAAAKRAGRRGLTGKTI